MKTDHLCAPRRMVAIHGWWTNALHCEPLAASAACSLSAARTAQPSRIASALHVVEPSAKHLLNVSERYLKSVGEIRSLSFWIATLWAFPDAKVALWHTGCALDEFRFARAFYRAVARC